MTVAVENIKQVHFPKRTLACANHTGPYMNDPGLFANLFAQVGNWASPKGLMTTPGMEAISAYHNDPQTTPPEEHRISVGFTVPEGTVAEGDIDMLELTEGNYLVGSFEIPADGYAQAWKQVMDHICDENLKPAQGAPMYESYKNNPNDHPEGKHIVDICVLLEG